MKFTCELCKKEVKRGSRFSIDVTEWDCETSGTGYDGADKICLQCAKKIEKKLDSMRK